MHTPSKYNEDEHLPVSSRKRLNCVHDFVDFYHGAGISKQNKNIMNIHVFCKKCLTQRRLKLDISDNDYEDEDE